MKRKSLVKIHVAATIVAAQTIVAFFTTSVIAEIKADPGFIREVKFFILCAMPIMIIAMPALNITGTKLAGKSQNKIILVKKKRMKLMMLNGIGLMSLAIFLFYRSHYGNIDGVFLGAQIVEFILGLTNLTLIGLNARSGFELSGRLKRVKK